VWARWVVREKGSERDRGRGKEKGEETDV